MLKPIADPEERERSKGDKRQMDKGNRKPAREMSGGCLVLFALPFLVAGIAVCSILISRVVEHVKMRSWVEVPATILSAELEIHDSDDSQSYKAVATYEYEYAGKSFRGDRVGLLGSPDGLGKTQKQRAKELKEYARTKDPFPCFVDPDSPGDSILYPQMRVGMMGVMAGIGLIFSSVGIGLITAGWFGGRATKKEKERKEAMPDKPWAWGDGWKEGRIKSGGQVRRWVLAAVALIWNLVGWSVAIGFWEQMFSGENRWNLLILLVPVIGLILAWSVGISMLRWRKFGTSEFQMAEVPGVIGGRLAGAIVTNRHLEAEAGFVQRLVCEETVTSHSGGSRRSSTQTRALWEDERVLTGELMGDDRTRSAVPVLFGVPFDLPETQDNARKVKWKLEMEAAVSGVDYRARFEVPVFKTDQSSDDFVLDETPIAHLCLPGSLAERLRRAGAKVREDGRELQADFPLLLQKSAFCGLGFFTLIWFGFTALMMKLEFPILFPIAFGLFGVLFVAILLSLVFSNKRLVLRGTELVSSGGLLGREKRFRYNEISKVEKYCGMRSGTRVYFSVRVESHNGEKATLIPDLRPSSTPQVLADEIERRMASDNYG